MTLSCRGLSLLILGLLGFTARAEERQLWLYYPTNLLVEKNLDKLQDVWGRAAKAGYAHVLLSDSKFSRLPDMDKRYFDHCERVKRIAADLKLTLVPALFSVGYSNDLLSRDPNLAEGLPVKDAPFVVKDGVAKHRPDPAVDFKPKFDFVDEGIRLDAANRTATVTDNPTNARLSRRLKLTPYRHYHVSVQVKTQEFSGKPEIKALAGGVSLNWTNLGAKRTQDWTTHHVTFNSAHGRDALPRRLGRGQGHPPVERLEDRRDRAIERPAPPGRATGREAGGENARRGEGLRAGEGPEAGQGPVRRRIFRLA
jgi:hypothetical protein